MSKTCQIALVLVLVVNGLVFALCFIGNDAKADSVDGTWISRVAGEGYVDDCNPYTAHWDCTLTLTQDYSGSVSGSSTITCTRLVVKMQGWDPGFHEGSTFPATVSGTVSGGTFTMTAGSETFTLTVSGDSLTGSGVYSSAGWDHSWTYDLVRSGGGGNPFGSGSMDMGSAAIAVAVPTIAIGAAAAVSGAIPPPRMHIHHSGRPNSSARTYTAQSPNPPPRLSTSVPPQPSFKAGDSPQDTGSSPPFTPIAATNSIPISGPGASVVPAYDSSTGNPVSPHDWPKVEQPSCPLHPNVALEIRYPFGSPTGDEKSYDPGSWWCPGPPGHFPWGRYPLKPVTTVWGVTPIKP